MQAIVGSELKVTHVRTLSPQAIWTAYVHEKLHSDQIHTNKQHHLTDHIIIISSIIIIIIIIIITVCLLLQ